MGNFCAYVLCGRPPRQLLHSYCIVSSYLGIARFNINGITLHSLLKLPRRGKNCCELKHQTLADLQLKFHEVKYCVKVIGRNIFGCIDRRLHQVTSKLDVYFIGILILLVGDFSQLPPVADKPLYYYIPSGNMGYFG